MSGYRVKISGAPTRSELVDYRCTECGEVFERFEDRTASAETVPCPNPPCDGAEAVRIFSAPHVGTNWMGDVRRGKSDPRPHPGVMDTRELAEGMPLKEWKKKRKAFWRDRDMAEIKQKVG